MSLGLWNAPIKIVHNMTGTLIGMVHIMIPFLILPVNNALGATNHDYLMAACNLGSSPRKAFWNVCFPPSMSRPLPRELMMFVPCLRLILTPVVLDGGKVIMMSMKIVSTIKLFVNWGAASELGIMLLLITIAILWIASRLVNLSKMTGGGH